jgi:hypothetical protein
VQRCHGAPSTLAIAFFSPFVGIGERPASTPTEARATRALSKSVQNQPLGLGSAVAQGDELAPDGLVHAVGDDHARAHHAAAVA